MQANYIILHGSFGSPDGNWFPWLKTELESKGKQVDIPQMPVGVGQQNFESWAKVLDDLTINQNTIIIAHSIAPVFVCKYLLARQIAVKKLIFVCGFNNYLGADEDFDAVNAPMFTNDFANVKRYCDDVVCFYSDNDPYVPYEIEKGFADKVATKQIVLPGAEHINSESGYDTFREALVCLEE